MGKKFASPSNRRNAFSLIEVVLAIGVVAFALVGIFSLFSTSLKTNRDSSSQQECFEVPAMVISWMQNTNVFTPTTLSNLFTTNYNRKQTNAFFVYTSNPPAGSLAPSVTIMTNATASALPTTFSPITNGMLYYVQVLPCTNLPTNVFPGANTLPVSTANWPSWPGYPGHAIVYALQSPRLTNASNLSNSVPVISFDFIIPK